MPTPVRRRSVLLASTAGTLAGVMTTAPAHAGGRPQFAYVGSRTTKALNARGAGITVWRVQGSRPWTLVQTITADDADPTTPSAPGEIPINPSFLALNKDGQFLYAVHGDATQVSAFARNAGTGSCACSTQWTPAAATRSTSRSNPPESGWS